MREKICCYENPYDTSSPPYIQVRARPQDPGPQRENERQPFLRLINVRREMSQNGGYTVLIVETAGKMGVVG